MKIEILPCAGTGIIAPPCGQRLNLTHFIINREQFIKNSIQFKTDANLYVHYLFLIFHRNMNLH